MLVSSIMGSSRHIILLVIAALLLAPAGIDALKRPSPLHSDVIEEVEAKRLEKLIQEQEFIAVFFYTRTCENCKDILEELEKIDDDANKYGVEFVKNSERAASKKYGINTFPTLVYFRHGEPTIYEGDLMNEENVLEWLISVESMDLPDRIEEVNARILQNYIDEHDFVAVLFYQQNHRKSDKVLAKLEDIDDDADERDIGFVKISDEALAYEYGLEELPALVYYRKQIPIVYSADLENEKRVLDWLIEFRDTVDDPDEFVADSDEIEDVSASVLTQLIENTDALAVLFYDDKDADSMEVLQELENIDDECDQNGIAFVKIDDIEVSKRFGIEYDELPTLVYFEEKIPNFYQGDLMNEEKVLEWLIHQKNTDEIEDVSDAVLENMIDSSPYLAVLFYDRKSKESNDVLKELENIDDECDEKGIAFVKIDDAELAKTYGLHDELPALVYFENKIPSMYQGDLKNEEKVLEWLIAQTQSDDIEEVSHELLNVLVQKNNLIAALIYKPKDKQSEKVLRELEHIDDECDEKGIAFVKTDDMEAAEKYGIRKLPVLLFFKYQVPVVYSGDLTNEDKVLEWLLNQQESDEIEEVNSKTLKNLIETTPALAVFFYDDSAKSAKALKELETIDDDADRAGIAFVRISDESVAKDFGVADELPVMVYFENRLPSIYEGDLTDEEAALEWLVKQKTEDTIEEVTEEILEQLFKEREYVLVFFAPNNCKECENILHGTLEHIDDDTDEHGILFVTTDDMSILERRKIKIDKFPALVLFRNEDPIIYKGSLKDANKILTWLTDDDTLDDPDDIEEVNDKMLDKILDRSPYVAVLFIKDKCSECDKVLAKLENVDHIAEDAGIDFVRVKDMKLAKEYNIISFPALIFFRRRIPLFYEAGSLKEADKVLDWLLKQKDQHEDVIENVDRHMLSVLLSDVDHITVFFYDQEECSAETKKRAKEAKKSKKSSGKGKDDKDSKDDKDDSHEDEDICERILKELENIDDDTDQEGIHFVKIDDAEYAHELGITDLPALVYFEEQQPSIYDGDLLEEEDVLDWLVKQKNEDTIENINREILFRMIAEREYLAVFFYKPEDDESAEIAEHLEKIDDDCADYDVGLVKINDQLIAKKYGIRQAPGLVYFRRGKHIRFDGNLFDEDEILEWLTKPDNMELSDAIEKVNRRMFERLLERTNYLSVLFYSKKDCKNCEKILEELERIDDEADAAGIKFVKIEDNQLATEYGVYALPGLVFFKKGEDIPVIFAGDFKKAERILEWLINQKDPMLDRIEEVESGPLRKLIDVADHMAVFFSKKKPDSPQLKNQPQPPEAAPAQPGKGGKKSPSSASKPSKSADDVRAPTPSKYSKDSNSKKGNGNGKAKAAPKTGPIATKQELRKIAAQLPPLKVDKPAQEKPAKTAQPTPSKKESPPKTTSNKSNHLEGSEESNKILDDLENIDTETDKNGIIFVKTKEDTVAKEYGIKDLPALIYFEKRIPSIYQGDISAEEDVLQWLVQQKTEDTIESVNRELLEQLIVNTQYLVVYFYKPNCKACDIVLDELENIDDDCEIYGINFVKIQDQNLAKRYGIKNYPALVYFRNGNPLIYDGDLRNEESVFEWLIEDENREIADQIEDVNGRMLDKLINDKPFLAVLFYGRECPECEEAVKALENIDDDADVFGIDFVKVNDVTSNAKYSIQTLPTLAFFRKQQQFLVYEGDLTKEEEVLTWLTSNEVFNIKDEIEEVNRRMLEKIVSDNEFVAVYFYEDDCYDCDAILNELEHIDDDTDELDIMFVKIRDTKYARKYGINDVPALVFFRKKFPSIYRGDLIREEEVLEWLKRNRYRHPELNFFMFAITGITGAFVFYTMFLIFCIRRKKNELKSE